MASSIASPSKLTPLQWEVLRAFFAREQVHVPDGASLPAGVAPPELRAYLADLVHRLRVAAAPREME